MNLVTRTSKLPHKLVDSGAYQGLAEYLFVKNTAMKTESREISLLLADFSHHSGVP